MNSLPSQKQNIYSKTNVDAVNQVKYRTSLRETMNWVPLNSQDIRNAPGQVDFLSIHRKAFSSEEIKEFYQESKTP